MRLASTLFMPEGSLFLFVQQLTLQGSVIDPGFDRCRARGGGR